MLKKTNDQNKAKEVDKLALANKELAFQNEEKDNRVDKLALANKELAFQNEEKENRVDKLALANKELAFQNEEKEKRADELALANKELAFQNEEKEKRADELALANKELDFQNEEKEKRADELTVANEDKEKRAGELAIANKELAFQNKEKEKRADELALANKELAFQNKEKDKRADELALANKELAFQNEEKDKRADELTLANEEKEKRADELALANKELAFQNEEKDKRADELVLANKEKAKRADELVLANKEKAKRADELILANKELAFQIELDGYRSEMERVAQDLTLLIDTANAPIFGIDAKGKVNEWNQQARKITGFSKKEVLGRDLVADFITDDYKVSVNEVLAKALKGKETANFEFPLFTKLGDRVDVLMNSTTRRDASGEIIGVVGVGQDITELNKVRVEQVNIAHEMTQLVDTANAPIFGIDAQGRVNEWNQQAANITGFNKMEVMGLDLVADFIKDNYKASVGEVLEKALKGEETANYEFPLFTKSGDRVDILLNSTTRRDASGRIIGVVGVGQDITELNKVLAEQASIANEMTQLVDTANAPIFGIDAQGKVNEWNQQAANITGFNKMEVMGLDLVADFITDDYKASVGEVLERALKGEETANYEFPLFTKSGNRVDVLLNSTTRRDSSGRIIGVVGVGQDITELNKVLAEQASIANEMTQLVDTANAPIFGIDAQGKVNEWNQQAANITGFNKMEVMGLDLVADFITDDYKASVGEVLERALKGEETANYEFPLFTKSGDRVDILLNSTTRRDASGRIVGVVGVGQDITELNQVRVEQEIERKLAAAQIIQSSKLATLGEMATSVAHELNQPLNVIRMAAGNSRRKIFKGIIDPQYLNDKLERIEGQTARAAAIIDHMRMFGREAKENPEPIDPRNVVINALDLMGEQLRLAGVEIVTEFAENCTSILGHSIQMEQVILNLLTNARDAMVETAGEAKITLRVFEVNKFVHITSEDTGSGIPEDVLSRIFEPFYTTKEMGKGTGLGLSVSYGIVRDMNGSIIAENIHNGARFTITLPIAN
jgi:PAS domain S-box-containing protein